MQETCGKGSGCGFPKKNFSSTRNNTTHDFGTSSVCREDEVNQTICGLWPGLRQATPQGLVFKCGNQFTMGTSMPGSVVPALKC